MSSSKPSAIVLHGILCIGGLYISFDSNGENGRSSIFDQGSSRFTLSRSGMRSGTGLPSPVENRACGSQSIEIPKINPIICLDTYILSGVYTESGICF